MTLKEKIQLAENLALSRQSLDRDLIIQLLAIDPESPEAELLGQAARRVAAVVTDNTARIWASIGVDYQPCPMNCNFCSFGEAWGVLGDSYTMDTSQVIELSRQFVSQGADWITLRTTEDYGFQGLIDLAAAIRQRVPGDYELVANTGDLNASRSDDLYDQGFRIAYHAIRLREGIDTPFQPVQRGEILETIKDSKLKLAFLVEPIGPEHTNEEIADVFLSALQHGATLSGAMARVPIPGTPLFQYGPLPEKRLAQIIAVTRLGSGYQAPDICVHPPSKQAMDWGANVVVVDVGAIPRATDRLDSAWQGFDLATARSWFQDAGYHVRAIDQLPA